RRPPHACPRARPGADRSAAGRRTGPRRRPARHRTAGAAELSVPFSPASDRADSSTPVVAQRALARHPARRLARSREAATPRAARDRDRHRRLRRRSGGAACAWCGDPDRAARAARAPGTHDTVFARYGALGRVVVRGFLDPIALAYRSADLVVSRAGAMTVAELCAWGKPSVLVPLPSAAADHQTSNARALEAAGAALHIAERDLSPHVLASRVRELLSDRQRLESLAACARARGNPNAARE